MGIKIEVNPELALRAYGTQGRLETECVPESLVVNETYEFLKSGQRVYSLDHPTPLTTTRGNGELSNHIAAIQIIETTHFRRNGETWTRGTYKIIKLRSGEKPLFDGTEFIGE